jgi:hypothetical protein
MKFDIWELIGKYFPLLVKWRTTASKTFHKDPDAFLLASPAQLSKHTSEQKIFLINFIKEKETHFAAAHFSVRFTIF